MTKAIVLDTGPLGTIAHPRLNAEIAAWLDRHLRPGTVFVVPEIADYELRRELLRADLHASLVILDRLHTTAVYLPLTSTMMRRAAQLWARTRREHRLGGDDKALGGDVILAAQVEALLTQDDEVVVATENAGHLGHLVPTRPWRDIA